MADNEQTPQDAAPEVTVVDDLPLTEANAVYIAQDERRRDQVDKLKKSVSNAIGAAFSPKGQSRRP